MLGLFKKDYQTIDLCIVEQTQEAKERFEESVKKAQQRAKELLGNKYLLAVPVEKKKNEITG